MSGACRGRLFTGCWAHVLAYETRGLLPVRISLGAPRWLPGAAHRWPTIRELMPVGALFQIEDAAEFELAYRGRLERIGLPAIKARFEQVVAERAWPLILVCFESDANQCHRGTFADWWLERTGEAIHEFQHQGRRTSC